MSDYASMKVPELKKLLADRKLPQTGNKADLIARLQEEDSKPAGAAEDKPGTFLLSHLLAKYNRDSIFTACVTSSYFC